MDNYNTLTEAITALRSEGYTVDFNLQSTHLEWSNGEFRVFHDEFHVDRFFRFDGMTDPSDESVLYAISSDKYQIKGLLVNGYGISSESITDDMLLKLK